MVAIWDASLRKIIRMLVDFLVAISASANESLEAVETTSHMLIENGSEGLLVCDC